MNTEKVNFGGLTAEQAGKLSPVQVVLYNPDWKILFEQEKDWITALCKHYFAVIAL